jgi:CSLREA domain-containing protein
LQCLAALATIMGPGTFRALNEPADESVGALAGISGTTGDATSRGFARVLGVCAVGVKHVLVPLLQHILFGEQPMECRTIRARRPHSACHPHPAIAAAIEPLELRRLLSTVTVTTVSDDLTPNDGSVSLREAITAMNAGNDLGDPDVTAQNPGTFGTNDTINFNIPGAGVRTISVGTDATFFGVPFPDITNPVTING